MTKVENTNGFNLCIEYDHEVYIHIVNVLLDKDHVPITKKMDYGYKWDPAELERQLQLGHCVKFKFKKMSHYEKNYVFLGSYLIGLHLIVSEGKGREQPPYFYGTSLPEEIGDISIVEDVNEHEFEMEDGFCSKFFKYGIVRTNTRMYPCGSGFLET